MTNAVDEFSKMIRKRIGSVTFKKLKQPRKSYFLASLDLDDLDGINKRSNWNFHICVGDDETHEHYLLTKVQAEKLHTVLSNYLTEYDKKFNKN
ncbi:MAG: hypothetical protein PHY93_20840 [Bacteriovorax sp.]|nr:hypothetical protein [Bacteriovorax sp.]